MTGKYVDYKYYEHPYLLVPYTPEIPETSSDMHICEAYCKLHKEGLYPIAFHDNPNMTMGRYMAWFNSDRVLAQFIFKYNDDKSVSDMACMMWLSNIEQCGDVGRGAASFVVFRDYQDGVTPITMAKLAFRYWFDELNMTVITGTTPTLNRAAVRFVRKIGMIEAGIIPKYANYKGRESDVLISYMNRDIFEVSSAMI